MEVLKKPRRSKSGGAEGCTAYQGLTSVLQSKATCTDGCHRAGAIALGDRALHADGVWEIFLPNTTPSVMSEACHHEQQDAQDTAIAYKALGFIA